MKNPRPTSRCVGAERVGRGDAKNHQHLNREHGGFAIAVAEVFSFRDDWHQDDRALPLIRQYQLTLDAILRDHPDLASCAVHCRHCGIRFLTHPRNAHRQNLHCPFGCRDHHRRQQAKERSRKHYRTDKGRKNKKRLNGKRSAAVGGIQKRAPQDVTAAGTALEDACPCEVSSGSGEAQSQAVPPRPHPSQQSTLVDLQVSFHHDTGLTLDEFKLDEATLVNSPILPYLSMVATVIEGRVIGVEELLHVPRRSMRQRSFDRLPRREYVLGFLNQHPP